MAVSAPVRRTPAPPKQAARRPLFLLGIGMSVLAFLLVLVLGTVIAGRATAGTAQVAVVVAARDIHHREAIAAGDLTTARVPASAVPPAAALQAGQLTGKVAQVDVLKGQPITTNLVAASGTGDAAFLPIPSGWVAVTIPAGELQAVAGYVAAGDAIDIQATLSEAALNPSAASPRQLTRTVFRGVHVIRIGPAAATAGPVVAAAQGVTSSLTVLLTPCDAPYMTWLVTNGSVRYTLQSAKDYARTPTGPDPGCAVGVQPARVGPAEVDAKFGFTRG